MIYSYSILQTLLYLNINKLTSRLFCPPFLLVVFNDLRSMIAAGYNIVVVPMRRPESPWVNLFGDTHIARRLLDQTP